MKRLIVCADNRPISQEGYWKYMIQATQHYAKLHAIDFHFEHYSSDFERHLSWRRIELFKSFIEKYDEIFWIDSDATIINPQINIFDYTTNAGIHRGIQDLEIQTYDSPSLFELLGRKAFFLHIPGQNCFEGQKELFEITKNIITDNTIAYDHPLKKSFKWKEKNSITFP